MYSVARSRAESGPLDDETGQKPFVIEDSLGYLVNRLARGFALALSNRLALHGISVAQWAILLSLWAEDGPTQRSLSRNVAIDEATMARSIDRMERDGLVQRRRNSADRRQQNVFLTERAAGLQDLLIPHAMDVNTTVTASMSRSERDDVSNLIRQMLVALDAMNGNAEVKS